MSHSTFLAIFKFLMLMILSIDAQYQPNRSTYCQVNGKRGRCIRVNDCPLVTTMLQQSLSRTTSYLRENHCGFDGPKPLVCCISEYQLSQARPTGIQTDNRSRKCQVDDQEGNCLLVNECGSFRFILRRSRKLAASYLKQNVCSLNDSMSLVCCVSASTYDMTLLVSTIKNSSIDGSENSSLQDGSVPTVDLSSNPYLPNVCGRDRSVKNLFNGRTVLGEFPWIVLLEHRLRKFTVTTCSGVLINRRYILTSAHCIISSGSWRRWNVTSVRLGEHNTETEIDCVKDDQGNVQCADSPISVGVEEEIIHDEFYLSDEKVLNNIALLRLNHDVPFTKFIRPICLPNTSFVSDKLYIAGWLTQSWIPHIKLKQCLPLVDKVKCRELYSDRSVSVDDWQMCAGGEGGYGRCLDHAASPLMSFERLSDGTARWTVVGVLSFSSLTCGPMPSVYTNVSQYVPWILSKIRG